MIVVELHTSHAQPRGRPPEALFEVARSIPGLRWKAGRWNGYSDAIGAFGHLLEHHRLATCIDLYREPVLATPIKLTDSLAAYQKEGVSFLAPRVAEGAYCAFDVGLGKTRVALEVGKITGASSVLVVCPAIVKSVWWSEVHKWFPGRWEVSVLSGLKSRPLLLTDRVTVVNYDILHAWASHLTEKEIDLLVIDEAHYLQRDRARRSRATKIIAEKSKARLALSGTPFTRPVDLWSPIETISPGRLGRYWGYGLRYCDFHKEAVTPQTIAWKRDGKSNTEELAYRLGHFMIRKTQAECLPELPPRTLQSLYVDVPGWAVARMLADDVSRDVLRRALDLAGSGKVPHASELAKSKADEGNRVVVFTHLRKTAHALGKNLKAPVITGDVSLSDRLVIIQGAPTILVATTDSVGIGIDLSYANVAIFVDLDWVPSKLVQAIGRLARRGQKKHVVVYFLIGRGTVDEQIKTTVLDRLATAFELLGDDVHAQQLSGALNGEDGKSEGEILGELREAILRGEVSDAA